MISGRPRLSSVRSPSFAFHARSVSASASPEVMAHRRLPSSSSGLSPTPEQQGHVRMPSASGQSQFLSPLVGVGLTRTPSNAARPSFADLSARRASRPVFDAFPSPSPGMRFRFPSSAPARALPIGRRRRGRRDDRPSPWSSESGSFRYELGFPHSGAKAESGRRGYPGVESR